MHEHVVFVYFWTVSFTCESCKSFFKHVNSERVIGGNQHIDSQIKLMSVDKKRVREVSWDDWQFIHIHFSDIINNVNAPASTHISRFDYPEVLLWFLLLYGIIMVFEVSELLGQYVGIWDYVKIAFSKFLLHLDHIKAQSVFPCDLVARWEMIDPLVLVKAFIEVSFATWWGPEDIPFMTLSVVHSIGFAHGSHKLCVSS